MEVENMDMQATCVSKGLQQELVVLLVSVSSNSP